MDVVKDFLILLCFGPILVTSISNLRKDIIDRKNSLENCINDCKNLFDIKEKEMCIFKCNDETTYNSSIRVWVFVNIISLGFVCWVFSDIGMNVIKYCCIKKPQITESDDLSVSSEENENCEIHDHNLNEIEENYYEGIIVRV